MRNAILAITVALALATAQLQAEPPNPNLPADVGSGRIAWFDVTTSDLAKSKEFYSKLFDWTYAPIVGTDQVVEIVSGGTHIGTLRGAEGAISAFNGVVYVQVADIRASSAKAKGLGGTVVPGFPFNLPDNRGALSLILDPSGHPMGMYSRTPIPAAAPPAQ
jgi:uncharacterized protein